MDTKVRDVKVGLTLQPIYWQDYPTIEIKFNGESLFNNALIETTTFDWLLPAKDTNRLSIFLLNKSDRDTINGRDKAVVVNSIRLEELEYPLFMHLSKYQPEYSEGYYQYAEKNNITVEPVIHSNYLGFNGEWFFEFAWPTFSWIYNMATNDEGWVYEKNI